MEKPYGEGVPGGYHKRQPEGDFFVRRSPTEVRGMSQSNLAVGLRNLLSGAIPALQSEGVSVV